ncbi:MAG: TIR domain-containing protein [Roseiarcus sp.]
MLVLGGMYAAHSDWIDYEIREAQRMKKTIVGIRPWAQERVPKIVQDASVCEPVGWNSARKMRLDRLPLEIAQFITGHGDAPFRELESRPS